MRSFKIFNRRVGVIFAAAALVFATALPGIVAAAQLTTRSIALSSTSASATGVTYNVEFTPVANARAFVIDFCENTPLYGEACTAPAGLDVVGVTSASVGFTNVEALGGSDANTLRVVGDMTATTPVAVAIAGIDNPTAAGTIYARIVTFSGADAAEGETNAEAYTSTGANTNSVDIGSVALSITPTVGVSAAVLETMTFCVSRQAPTQNCTGVTAPTLELGEDVGDGVIALQASTLSTGNLYAQISTNADDGAVVRLKSNAANCGGLLRAGAPSACDIAPALTGGTIAGGDAKFGVLAAAAADPVDATSPSGTFQVATGATYNNTTYEFNYVDSNSGVTSAYGDPFLDTDGDPVNNRNMLLTFGASISNSTPAGRYSADLSMIATGTF